MATPGVLSSSNSFSATVLPKKQERNFRARANSTSTGARRMTGGEAAASNEKFKNGRWTKDEHEAFIQGLREYGKEWKQISTLIPTRSIVQIRTHAQKFFQKIARVRFEKRGIEVPDALKSTAIKTTYSFDILQEALKDPAISSPSSESSQKSSSKLFLATPPGVLTHTPEPRTLLRCETAEMSSFPRFTDNQPKAKVERVNSTPCYAMGRTRRSSRKGSKYSVDLQHVIKVEESEARECRRSEDELARRFGIECDFDAPTATLDCFNMSPGFGFQSQGVVSREKKARACSESTPFNGFGGGLSPANTLGEEHIVSDTFRDFAFGADGTFPGSIFLEKNCRLEEYETSDSTSTNSANAAAFPDPLVELMNSFGEVGVESSCEHYDRDMHLS